MPNLKFSSLIRPCVLNRNVYASKPPTFHILNVVSQNFKDNEQWHTFQVLTLKSYSENWTLRSLSIYWVKFIRMKFIFLVVREKLMLVGIRKLLKDPETFLVEFYNPVSIVDTLKYVFEEQRPASCR